MIPEFKEFKEFKEFETMNIYSFKGDKVTYTGKNGYDSDKEYADKHLVKGNDYTVLSTDVGQSSSTVTLQEFPDKRFNTVHFIDKQL